MSHAGFERPEFVFSEPPQTIAASDPYVASGLVLFCPDSRQLFRWL